MQICAKFKSFKIILLQKCRASAVQKFENTVQKSNIKRCQKQGQNHNLIGKIGANLHGQTCHLLLL
jgi:hypothetical protein